jgi:hypothetical protein
VVQIDPGPMPTFTASAPASASAFAPAAVPTFAGNHLQFFEIAFDAFKCFYHSFCMAMRAIEANHIYTDILQSHCAVKHVFCDAQSGTYAKTSEFILYGERMASYLEDVL